MIKTTAFIGLCLCILLLSGCAPKIDGSSAKSYENSLVKVTTSLESEKRHIFLAAVEIVVNRAAYTGELSKEANNRIAISNKTADDIINEATGIAVKELDEYRIRLSEAEKANAGITAKEVAKNIVVKVIEFSETNSESLLSYKSSAQYDVLVEITNRNTFDIDGMTAHISGVDESGTEKGWTGLVCFGRHKLQGVIPASSTRKVHIAILDLSEQNDDFGSDKYSPDATCFEEDSVYSRYLNWSMDKHNGLPTTNELSHKVEVTGVYAGDKTYRPFTETKQLTTLPSDIDRFLTLIKYKR